MTFPGDRTALFQALLSSSSEVLLVLDTDGRCTWVSPSIEPLLGHQVGEVTGRFGTDFIHPDDASRAVEQQRWVGEEPGRTRAATWRVRHADGSWIWVEARSTNLMDHPDVGGIVASLRDVSDRRRAEDALRDSEARFRAVVQNSRDVTGILAADGTIIWASPNAEIIFGHPPEALAGMQGFDFVHPEDRAAGMERLALTLESGTPADPIPLRLLHAEGFWTPIEIAGSALQGPDGEVEGLIVNLRDISWRVGAEQALRDSEERFRALVQNSSDVVMVLDAERKVTFVSPSVERVFGYRPEELIGDKGVIAVHPDDVERLLSHFDTDAAEPGSTTSIEYRGLDTEGGVHWVEATVTNLLEEPGVHGIVVNVRDTTDRVDAEIALREREAMFRSLTESSPVGIYTADDEGRCLYVNDRYLQIMGLEREQAMGHGWVRAVHPDDLTWLLSDVGNTAFQEPVELTYRVVHPDGAIRWVTVHTSQIADAPEPDGRSVGVIEDITDQVMAQRDTERLTDIFEVTHDLVGITDAEGKVQYVNRAARMFFGVKSSRDLTDLALADLFAPWAVEQLAYQVEPKVEREGIWNGELALARPDGTEVPVLAQVLAHRDGDGQIEFFSAVLRDISERKAFEHELAHQATHDPLTGLPNRVLLLDELDKALARARRHGRSLAVLFIDLDHFKVVNDSLGHGVGDRLLVAIAERLRLAIRPGDTIARFGGDEFVLMCEDLESIADATAIAKRVEHSVITPFELDDGEVYVGVSIGIAVSQPQDESETLIRDADAAMYRAKAKGRGRFEVFDSAMRAHAVDRLDIENALRRAGRPSGVARPLPADHLPGHRADRRHRGPPPLGAPPSRPAAARRLHHDRRGDGPHRAGRRMGPLAGVPAAAAMGGGVPRDVEPDRDGEPLGSSAHALQARRRGRLRAHRDGHRPGAARPGDHGERAHGRRGDLSRDPAEAEGPGRAVWRSTTSGPATPRSATCASSPST